MPSEVEGTPGHMAVLQCPSSQAVPCCIAFLIESLLLQGLGDTMSERDIDDLFTLAGRLLRGISCATCCQPQQSLPLAQDDFAWEGNSEAACCHGLQ